MTFPLIEVALLQGLDLRVGNPLLWFIGHSKRCRVTQLKRVEEGRERVEMFFGMTIPAPKAPLCARLLGLEKDLAEKYLRIAYFSLTPRKIH